MDAVPRHSPQPPARVRHPMVEANIGESPRGSRPKVFPRTRSSGGARATPRHRDRAPPPVAFAPRRSSSPPAAPPAPQDEFGPPHGFSAVRRRRRFRQNFGKISAKFRSFSAVSAPIFARKYAFCSIFQNLPDYPAESFEIWQYFAIFATFAKFLLKFHENC